LNPDETYAVKITRNGDPEILNIMKQTFLNTLKLNNPFILKTHKLYIDSNMERSYLIMEYLPYPSLQELLK
jgi:maternal embryonic leucine zipper kinase